MKKQTLFKIVSMLIVVATLILPLAGQSELVQAQSPTLSTQGFLVNRTIQNSGLDTENPEQKLWVVRVYFTERAQVEQIAAWIEPWEVHYDEGYLVIDVTEQEFNLLVAQGFRVDVDQKLTELINQPLSYLPGQLNGIPGYTCYRTVDETYATATDIVADYPQLAEWIDIGDSWEKATADGLPGYDMRVLKLTNHAIGGDKPKFFVMSAIHAREYTTAELNTRFAEYLVENYNVDPDVTWLLDYTEIHLLLQSNPDGRKQAETGLMWRKNTNQNYCGATSSNRGADLNRNFDFQWGCCGGSSDSQCDETYRGPFAASEPEVQAVQNYVRSIFPDQRGENLTDPAPEDATGVFLDLHSYSQLVLWSWGFTYTTAPNNTALQTLGRKFAYFNDYEPEQSVGLYPTDGTTDDFAYGELGVAAYTFEMGTSFFQDCSTFENTIIPENLPALIYAAKVSRTPYMTPAGPDVLNPTLTPNAVSEGDSIILTATINDTRYNNQNGTEPTQNIAAAVYYVDIPPWEAGAVPQTMTATDGYFNSKVETVTATVDTTGLSNGRHIIYMQGQDAAGNWGAISAAFLYVIDPAVAPVIQGTVRQALTNAPLAATVVANDTFQTTTDPVTGFYQMYVISGTFEIEASADGYGSQAVSGVNAQDTQTVDQDFLLAPVCTAFSDDVESGNIGWTAQSPWAITTESSHSSTHSWTDSPGGNYSNYRNVAITSPIIDLSGYSDVHLDFWQICNTEAGYDYCHVEISDNGGTSWTEIATYDGSHTQWEQINLGAALLDNQPDARVRFRLTSDSYITADGWHLDDIQITGAGESCINYTAPTADFASSSPDPLGTPTEFTNLSYGTDLEFEWNFGDSSSIITETNPIHTFGAAGTYTVTLTASNLLGTDQHSEAVEILAVYHLFLPIATK